MCDFWQEDGRILWCAPKVQLRVIAMSLSSPKVVHWLIIIGLSPILRILINQSINVCLPDLSFLDKSPPLWGLRKCSISHHSGSDQHITTLWPYIIPLSSAIRRIYTSSWNAGLRKGKICSCYSIIMTITSSFIQKNGIRIRQQVPNTFKFSHLEVRKLRVFMFTFAAFWKWYSR